jgi:nucleotidyltransferase AbiEii toxin of type IV toxin-antitoxin system
MHPEVLTKPAAQLFPSLAHFPGFYLAGGTALALQIGHRASVDFDLFTDTDISPRLLGRVRREFQQASISPLVNDPTELTVLANGVKVTFLKYPFPVQDAFAEYDGVQLLSVREIAATKAYTIGRRGSYKDYVDLYFIVAQCGISLRDIIQLADKKFGTDFNSRLFLEQLVFLDDVQDMEIRFLAKTATPSEIIAYFERNIRENGSDF